MILLFHSSPPVWNTHSSLIMMGLRSRIRNCMSHTSCKPGYRAINTLFWTDNATPTAGMWPSRFTGAGGDDGWTRDATGDDDGTGVADGDAGSNSPADMSALCMVHQRAT